MRFSLYTEMQPHQGKTPERLYAEVLEQIANADRPGYDSYASAGTSEIAITVNAGGAPHWMAIENRELLAASVMRLGSPSPADIAHVA